MALVWNPWALATFVAAAIALSMVLFVLAVGQGRRTNRLLAAVYTLYGLAFGAVALVYSVDDPREAYAWQVVATALFFPATLLYPAFLGSALARAPRVLRSRGWLAGSILAGAAVMVLCVARGDLVAGGVIQVTYAPYEVAPGAIQNIYFLVAIAVSLLGLFLSALEFRAAPRGTLQRRRAGFFLAAFGIQDILLAAGATAGSVASVDSLAFALAAVFGFPLALVSPAVLVSYGILKYQLFDIDVKIKLGVKRTTLAGTFLAIIFVVAQLVEAFAGAMFGAIAGAVAAGLLLFAIAPLQRMAERVSDATMPRVRDTAEYRTVRKREVYLAAVESSMEDGVITDKERNVLATLADQLGLGVKETLEIERAAASARGRGVA